MLVDEYSMGMYRLSLVPESLPSIRLRHKVSHILITYTII